jgi:hypothetical protein
VVVNFPAASPTKNNRGHRWPCHPASNRKLLLFLFFLMAQEVVIGLELQELGRYGTNRQFDKIHELPRTPSPRRKKRGGAGNALGISGGFATELARQPSCPFAAQPNLRWAPGIWADDRSPRAGRHTLYPSSLASACTPHATAARPRVSSLPPTGACDLGEPSL